MMNCNEVNELVALYIDNELNDTELRAFEEHLETCEACRHEIEEILQLVRACGEIEEEELPEGFKNELHVKLLAAGAKENVEKKILKFPINKIRMFSSVAAGFIVVITAAFLLKGMILTPSKTNNSTMDMAAGNQRSAKAEINGYSVDGQNAKAAAAKSVESADEYNIAAADSSKDILVQFSEAVGTNSDSEVKVDADTKEAGTFKDKAAPADKVTTTAGSSGTESQPKLTIAATARIVLPEKRVASLTIYSEDMNATGEGLEKLVLANGGEKVVIDSRIMCMAAPTQPTDSAITFQFKIPNDKYTVLKEAISTTYGQTNVEAIAPEKQDLTATLDDLTKQSNELDAQIAKAESKEVKITEDELTRLKEEKTNIAAQLEAVNSELNFTYITVIVKKK